MRLQLFLRCDRFIHLHTPTDESHQSNDQRERDDTGYQCFADYEDAFWGVCFFQALRSLVRLGCLFFLGLRLFFAVVVVLRVIARHCIAFGLSFV